MQIKENTYTFELGKRDLYVGHTMRLKDLILEIQDIDLRKELITLKITTNNPIRKVGNFD